MDIRPRRRRWVGMLGILAFMGLVLAACGGDSGGGGGTAAPQTDDVIIAPTGDPTPGGKITYALEAESDGFNPTVNRWAISGLMVANAVFDPLAAYDAEGVAQPYLAQSFTPNATFTTWTITMRPNVQFHNGQPLDGAAVKKDLDALRASPLTGGAAANISAITVDPAKPLDVVVTTFEPWASFPATFTAQAGMIAAPAQLDAPAPDNSRLPIGTGPFQYKEWIPDKNWSGTKWSGYWQKDQKGNSLPYLDEIEFVPVPDTQNRVNAIVNGDVQMMHTTDWAAIASLKAEADAGKLQFLAARGENEETFVMFNTAVAPVDDVRVRQAAALCTDRPAYFEVTSTPPEYEANSQFVKTSPWYDPENGFPTYDPAAGAALIQQVEAEKGPVSFTLGTTPVPENQAATQILKSQWEACGMSVELKSTAQSTFVLDAALGNYQANLWRQFGGSDPDADYVWWTEDNAKGVGTLSLNFAQLSDPQVQAALDKARASNDRSVRVQAYSDLQRRQSELVPYVWLNHTQWAIGAANNVRNIGNQTLPDGSPSLVLPAGTHRLTQTWLQQ